MWFAWRNKRLEENTEWLGRARSFRITYYFLHFQVFSGCCLNTQYYYFEASWCFFCSSDKLWMMMALPLKVYLFLPTDVHHNVVFWIHTLVYPSSVDVWVGERNRKLFSSTLSLSHTISPLPAHESLKKSYIRGERSPFTSSKNIARFHSKWLPLLCSIP
jgi:hypothetical protein